MKRQKYTNPHIDRVLNGIGLMVLAAFLQILLYIWVYFYIGDMEEYSNLFWATFISSTIVLFISSKNGRDKVLAVSMVVLIELSSALYAINTSISCSRQSLIIWLSIITGVIFVIMVNKLFNIIYGNEKSILLIIYLLTVLLTIALKVNGSVFLRVGQNRLEITELYKMLAVLYYSILYTSYRHNRTRLFLELLYISTSSLALIYLNEYGTLAIVGLIFLVLQLVYGQKLINSVITICTLAGVIGLIVWASAVLPSIDNPMAECVSQFLRLNKIASRISTFRGNSDTYSGGYQIQKSLEALMLGKLTGSRMDIDIPVSESDFAFARMIASMGSIIGVVYLLMVDILQIRLIIIAKKLNDCGETTKSSLVTGSSIIVCLQTLIACGTNVALFPIMGNPALLISTGGVYRCVSISLLLWALSVSMTESDKIEQLEKLGGKCRCMMRRVKRSTCQRLRRGEI